MRERYISGSVQKFCFSAKSPKMAFVSGPRQCGKTTFAKKLISTRASGNYFNWDSTELRKIWVTTPSSLFNNIQSNSKEKPLVVLDEIHKAARWKQTLKGVFDTLSVPTDILVTGSAKLNVYRKGGDSLLGRYFHFHLHPLSVAEVVGHLETTPEKVLACAKSSPPNLAAQNALNDLLRYGSFPEPFLEQDEERALIWRQTRIDQVVREDVRDLSNVSDLSRIAMLVSLLPSRVGSLFSMEPLRGDLETTYDSLKRWLRILEELYYFFPIKPYSKKISRTLLREGKIYLWDSSELTDNGSKFENTVAAHLLKLCHYFTDTGKGKFEIRLLRNKEKQEIDFLILKDGQPWLPVEAKFSDTTPSPAWRIFLPQLKLKQGLQLVSQAGVNKTHIESGYSITVISAADFLANCI